MFRKINAQLDDQSLWPRYAKQSCCKTIIILRRFEVNAFTAGKPFLGTKLLEIRMRGGVGGSKGDGEPRRAEHLHRSMHLRIGVRWYIVREFMYVT